MSAGCRPIVCSLRHLMGVRHWMLGGMLHRSAPQTLRGRNGPRNRRRRQPRRLRSCRRARRGHLPRARGAPPAPPPASARHGRTSKAATASSRMKTRTTAPTARLPPPPPLPAHAGPDRVCEEGFELSRTRPREWIPCGLAQLWLSRTLLYWSPAEGPISRVHRCRSFADMHIQDFRNGSSEPPMVRQPWMVYVCFGARLAGLCRRNTHRIVTTQVEEDSYPTIKMELGAHTSLPPLPLHMATSLPRRPFGGGSQGDIP
jgi:hypothetical protein